MTAGPLTANKRSPGLLGGSRIPFPRQVRAAPAGQDAIPVIRVGAAGGSSKSKSVEMRDWVAATGRPLLGIDLRALWPPRLAARGARPDAGGRHVLTPSRRIGRCFS